jgi:hypothetical protein
VTGPLVPDPGVYAEALSALAGMPAAQRHATIAVHLAAIVETVASQGLDAAAAGVLCRGLAWAAAGRNTSPAGVYERDPDDYSPVRWPIRAGQFTIHEHEVSGYALHSRTEREPQ